MRFISTRGGEKVTGAEAVVRGIAANGGLFVPEKLPQISDAEMDGMLEASFTERTAKIIKKFFSDITEAELLSALEGAYSRFEGDDPAPLVRVDDGVYMLELFHGPTLSSKDMAVAALPHILKNSSLEGKSAIVAVTSGDLGKSVIECFRGSDSRVLVLYPSDGLSKMQKLQLVTEEAENAKVVAVNGTFDDCLSSVKELLSGRVITANSINFACLAPRIAYFYSAYLDLLSSEQIERGEEIDFYIPSGNLGEVVAAYYAKLSGLPIRKIHCATNENNSLISLPRTGVFEKKNTVVKTTSPSMDIAVPADIERLIFELSGRDTRLTAKRMASLLSDGQFSLTENELTKLGEIFDFGFANEETCVEAMYDVFVDTDYVMDTCTGCAMKVAHDWYEKNKKDETKAVIVAIDSPYKFPQDVLYAVTGNDVKDSFKGVKRLHDATAMVVPKCIKEIRDKPVIFNKTIDKKSIAAELEEFLK